MEQLRAVVTAGGTSEQIDDVRVITNLSSGRFGHALAAELAHNNIDTTELCPKSTMERFGCEEEVRYEHFNTADSLHDLLVERTEKPDIILHAAAVSDYKPVRSLGKIPSDEESLTITLERTPKIIGELRGRYGSETFIAGFKLLSGVSEVELVKAAMSQLRRNRLNMVIANDLQNLTDGQHPVLAVTAEGGVIPFEGERTEVARELAKFILKRVNVEWFKSVHTPEMSSTVPAENFGEVLSLVRNMHLLTDESGNVSVNGGNGKLLVSPRQVDKSALTEHDAIPVTVDANTGIVSYSSDRKPSIDTGVSSLLYREYPDLQAIIHFHKGWGRMSAVTKFPFPCGAKEEAEEMIKSIQKSDSEDVAVELVHHGFLLGLRAGDKERLQKEWEEITADFVEHLDEVVGQDVPIDRNAMRPIFDGLSVAGIIYDQPDDAAVFLSEHARGTGIGRRVIEQLIARKYTIRTVDDCRVRDFYKKHRFSETYDHESKSYFLTAPVQSPKREFEP